MRIVHNKLVRDRIPEIIAHDGHICSIRHLSDAEFLIELKHKLVEEAEEAQDASDVDALVLELADLLEVMTSILRVVGISRESVEKLRQSRAADRGGFDGKLYLVHVESDELKSSD